MKITNETYWRTEHIRALALAVARRQLMDPAQIDAMVIHVRWRKGRRLGEAFIGCSPGKMTRTMWLFMDRDKIDPMELAHTIGHEIGHQKGLTHRQMKGRPSYTYAPGWRDVYAWAAAFPVEQRPVRVRPIKPAPSQLEVAQTRYAEAAAKVKTWETKVKRAQTMLKKWQRRARLRQSKIAASAATQQTATPEVPCPVSPAALLESAGPSPSDHGL